MSITVSDKYLKASMPNDISDYIRSCDIAFSKVLKRNGAGNEMLGWVDLPEDYNKEEFERIKIAAKRIQEQSDMLLVIGIGGSYLGARAAIEFIKSPLYNNNSEKGTPDIYFLGNTINSDYHDEILRMCERRDFSVAVISKSGTTIEPAIGFRILRKLLNEKYGIAAKDRIYVISDKDGWCMTEDGDYLLDADGNRRDKSKLKQMAITEGYETFIVPDDVGGRYSVLTPVGLLPMAVAGCDIDKIMAGARAAREEYLSNLDATTNACLKYAILRNMLHKGYGKSVEVLAGYDPALTMMNEWWKQLFGESEGKDKKGLFPASMIFSTDLHSLGQFIQDGSRIMFETVINIENPRNSLRIPSDVADGITYINGVPLCEVNKKAMLATIIAHTDGGTPNILINISNRTEQTFGELVYFFELACAVSGYMLDVNPFNQPGVEGYKVNMFALLDEENPKYDAIRENLKARI